MSATRVASTVAPQPRRWPQHLARCSYSTSRRGARSADLATSKPALHCRLASRVDPVNSEHILCQVYTQCSNLHFRTLVSPNHGTKIGVGAVDRRTQVARGQEGARVAASITNGSVARTVDGGAPRAQARIAQGGAGRLGESTAGICERLAVKSRRPTHQRASRFSKFGSRQAGWPWQAVCF